MAEIGRRKGDNALLLALASGQTVRDAARLAGIGERTATRRMADPGFRRRVNELRGEMVGRALGKLADAATEAVDTLRKLLKAKADTVKLGARISPTARLAVVLRAVRGTVVCDSSLSSCSPNLATHTFRRAWSAKALRRVSARPVVGVSRSPLSAFNGVTRILPRLTS
jgi:hypothetical protein